jgi:NAD(P)-dependent dehydrogenase (short-subunit alcohol dehydrogenase family)
MNILITGASQGLGLETARLLKHHRLVLVARTQSKLEAVGLDAQLIAADVGQDAERIASLAGPIDVLINNASALGPMLPLKDYPWQELEAVLRTNVLAPLHLTQLLLPGLKTLVNITSDAGVNAYPTWGGYGLSKAALEHQTRTFAEENPGLRVLLVDPSDMNTEMHRQAEPGVDLSHLPGPERIAPSLVELLEGPAGFLRTRLEAKHGSLA